VSLIVARVDNEGIYIVSDTKLTAPDDQEFSKRQKNDAKEGVIKTTIIRPSCCISFAGNIDFADDALKAITPYSATGEIIEILRSQHELAGQRTDFILCVSEWEKRIYEIKNGQVTQVTAAWIGSQLAFNRFQSCMLTEGGANSQGSFISMSDASGGNLFHKMTQAIDAVIQDEAIPEVAGFKIRVCFDGQRFKYMGYLDSYFSHMQLQFEIPAGAKEFSIPITHATAAQGGYTINFFNSADNYNYVGLHLKQGKFGVVYKRLNGGLLYPQLFEDMDELDFLDEVKAKYRISPSGTTEDAVRKFGTLADACFHKGNFEEAIIWYDRGLGHLFKKEKARFYFNKALCLVSLKRPADAVVSFNEAVKLDAGYQAKAMEIMKNAFSGR
jgi:hypothetical protein